MKRLVFMFVLAMLALFVKAGGDENVMITRDGTFLKVKVIKISGGQVSFIDLNKKRRGELKAPVDYVYMIMKKEKGDNICFDEEGYQTTSPAKKLDDKATILFLNNGDYFPIFNLSIKREELVYQLKDKKKAPYITLPKSEAFLVRNSDGTSTLFNNKYIEAHSKK